MFTIQLFHFACHDGVAIEAVTGRTDGPGASTARHREAEVTGVCGDMGSAGA